MVRGVMPCSVGDLNFKKFKKVFSLVSVDLVCFYEYNPSNILAGSQKTKGTKIMATCVIDIHVKIQ